MNYEATQPLSPQQFKRRFGVRRSTFEQMLKALQKQLPPNPGRGRKPKLCLEERVMVSLEYWREYRTYFHISTDYSVSEATICRTVHWVEEHLMGSGLFRLPGKKRLAKGFGRPEVVVMDVTETPIERPKRKQRNFYSGKKKQHTLKCQIILDQQTQQIICTFYGKGRQHDFKLFKVSGLKFHPETRSLQDKAYQGIADYHANSFIPRKKPKGGELSSLEKAYNRELARERICIEHINRRLKVFKILRERYRNRRRRFGLRCNLIAALYNFELAAA